MDIRRAIRNALGGGADISVANPLPVFMGGGEGWQCRLSEVPAGEIYYVASADVWGCLDLVVEGQLRIDGGVHVWGDVTGAGFITGEGELRLHTVL